MRNRNKMKPAVAVPFVETVEAKTHRDFAYDQYLEGLANETDATLLESDAFGARVAAKVADGSISQETADALAAEFSFHLPDADSVDSDEQLREYASGVIALSDYLAELPENEIAEFLSLI